MPVRLPVPVLKEAHAGLPAIENLRVRPVRVSVTVGRKLYWLPALTFQGGLPPMVRAGAVVAATGAVPEVAGAGLVLTGVRLVLTGVRLVLTGVRLVLTGVRLVLTGVVLVLVLTLSGPVLAPTVSGCAHANTAQHAAQLVRRVRTNARRCRVRVQNWFDLTAAPSSSRGR
jgi:hypothetical protein